MDGWGCGHRRSARSRGHLLYKGLRLGHSGGNMGGVSLTVRWQTPGKGREGTRRGEESELANPVRAAPSPPLLSCLRLGGSFGHVPSLSASRGLAPVARPRVTISCTKECRLASEKSLKARLRALGSQGPKSCVVLGPPRWKSWRPALWHGPCAGDTTMAVASTVAQNWARGREGWSPQYCLRDGKRSFGCPWHVAVPRTKALRVCYSTAKAVKGRGEIMSNNEAVAGQENRAGADKAFAQKTSPVWERQGVGEDPGLVSPAPSPPCAHLALWPLPLSGTSSLSRLSRTPGHLPAPFSPTLQS